jgi:cell division protein FtsQ
MAEKRKISVRKILQFLLTLVVTAGCIVAVLSASRKEDEKYIRNIDIRIKNENKCRFIDKAAIMDLVANDKHIDLRHIPASQLDLHGMEEAIAANPWVGRAEIYVDNLHDLHLNVTQRVPVARVFDSDTNSYYLDTALQIMPLSDRYVHYTTVVTNVPVLKDKDSASNVIKAEVVKVVRFIERDTFWNAQVSQIIMQPGGTFELVPVLGHQRILIGDTSMLKEKFANLFAFYKSVLNRIGWGKYDVIDVRYKGQVVASPALPWNAPVDKAMSNMNWVKSIIGKDSNAAPVQPVAASTPPPAPAKKVLVPAPVKAEPKKAGSPAKPVAHAPPAKATPNVKKDLKVVKKETKKETVKKDTKLQKPEAKQIVKKEPAKQIKPVSNNKDTNHH